MGWWILGYNIQGSSLVTENGQMDMTLKPTNNPLASHIWMGEYWDLEAQEKNWSISWKYVDLNEQRGRDAVIPIPVDSSNQEIECQRL